MKTEDITSDSCKRLWQAVLCTAVKDLSGAGLSSAGKGIRPANLAPLPEIAT